ncbi:MBL fold metallo-hydrolase [Sporomusa aerivorans]|uniref:MBL fold metallo-hydrolase n=1 Tax=Sporomusa aerivorans TaxID=204936 RepID=UPI003529F096
MERIIDVTGGQGGKAFLLVGKEKTALMDCGMAYCASSLIQNIKEAIPARPLDYIIISHSHYDHIGAIPYLKDEWPAVNVLGAAYAQQVLHKPNALKTIRQLSIQAAEFYGAAQPLPYDDAKLKVDRIIKDGDTLSLGDMHITVVKTTGHTQCSLAFFINNEILFASETTGCLSSSGRIYPAFIISWADAINSITICRELNPRFIYSPHYGLVSQADTADYWDKCLMAVCETRDFILRLAAQGYDQEQILAEYERVFRNEESRREQPINAFRLNTQNMIKTVLREAQTG